MECGIHYCFPFPSSPPQEPRPGLLLPAHPARAAERSRCKGMQGFCRDSHWKPPMQSNARECKVFKRISSRREPMQSNARECKVLNWISDATLFNQMQPFLFFSLPRLPSCIGFALAAALAVDCLPLSAAAMDVVRFAEEGRVQSITGRVLVQATDGGLVMEARDGVLWLIEPREILSREAIGEAFAPLSREQFVAAILTDLPAGFDVHTTAHYVVCYNTSK